MTPRTTVWQWILSFVVLGIGATIAISLGRYAEADDAPGGVVIAALIFLVSAGLAMWIVGRDSRKSGKAASSQ